MSETGLKVLVLADSRSFHTERYVAELRRQGCQVLLASIERSELECHQIKQRGFSATCHYLFAVGEVRRLIGDFRPDIVNPHFVSGYGYLAARATPDEIPIVTQAWGSDILIVTHKSFLHRRKVNRALACAAAVVGDSDFILDKAESIAPLNSRHTIYWGIERAFLEFARHTDVIGRPLRIIVPRSHEAVYNNLFIVEALQELINERQVEITFPSIGGRLSQFKQASHKLVGDKVGFYEKLPRADYLRLAAQHDVYLSASLSDSSPASMIEAMGLGLIVVAGDIPGVREWLTPETGFAFDLISPAKLQYLISSLVTQNDPLTEMRNLNHERVHREAVFEDNIASTIDVMRRVSRKGRA